MISDGVDEYDDMKGLINSIVSLILIDKGNTHQKQHYTKCTIREPNCTSITKVNQKLYRFALPVTVCDDCHIQHWFSLIIQQHADDFLAFYLRNASNTFVKALVIDSADLEAQNIKLTLKNA
jgi:hypothetical protein